MDFNIQAFCVCCQLVRWSTQYLIQSSGTLLTSCYYGGDSDLAVGVETMCSKWAGRAAVRLPSDGPTFTYYRGPIGVERILALISRAKMELMAVIVNRRSLIAARRVASQTLARAAPPLAWPRLQQLLWIIAVEQIRQSNICFRLAKNPQSIGAIFILL